MLVHPKEGMLRTLNSARTSASRRQKQKDRRCHPVIVVASAVPVSCMRVEHRQDFPSMGRPVELLQPTAIVLDVWCQLLRVVSSCESRISGHAAEGDRGVVRIPPILISAVPSSSRQTEPPAGLSFPLAEQRVASRLASPCHRLPAPLEMGPAYRAVGAESRGYVRFRLSHVVPWSAECGNLPSCTGHLRHQ
jgi:hypothetical protein